MAIEFDGKGNIVGTTPDGAIAVKLYSLEKQIAELKSQLQQKENIIKEVREYIEKEREKIKTHQYAVGIRRLNKIEGILDKVDKE